MLEMVATSGCLLSCVSLEGSTIIKPRAYHKDLFYQLSYASTYVYILCITLQVFH